MSKEITTLDYSDKAVINTLKQTVAIGATDAEFAMFSEFCKSTGLNPFKKEIWFIKAGGRVQIMTGINGFLAIANSHPQYDGLEIDVEVDQQGNPLKAVCKVYRKDRGRPSIGIALMKEFVKPTPIWKQMPSVMLTKVAKSIALREAFPQELNGMYTAEEMPSEYSLVPVNNNGATVEISGAVTVADNLKQEKEEWTGNIPLGFGKHKDVNWCDVNPEYLHWLFNNTNGEKAINAGFEIARREEEQQKRFEAINEEAAKAQSEFDADEIPDFKGSEA